MRRTWQPIAGVVLAAALGAGLRAEAEGPESLVLRASGATRSERVLPEQEWAADLVRLLGLEEALPAEPSDADRFTLLCPERAELHLTAGGRELPEEGAFRVSLQAPRPRSSSAPVRSVVNLPATALYQLSVEGSGVQRWVIDKKPVGHLDLSPLGVAQAAPLLLLREGPHEISGYLAGNARVERIELTAYRPLCIAPADGWHQDRALTQGALARTLVRAFDLDRRLPEYPKEEFTLEGERFDEASAGGERTRRALSMPASGDGWAEAVASPAEFTWNFTLEEPRVVTVEARTHGDSPQIWSLDGRYRMSLAPRSVPAGFEWNHVVTIPLSAGRHALRGLVSRGSGVDAIRIVSHHSTDRDYAGVWSGLGFETAAAGAPVTSAAVRSAVSRPSFAQLAAAFRRRLKGDLGDRSLVLVDADPDPHTSRSVAPLLPAEL